MLKYPTLLNLCAYIILPLVGLHLCVDCVARQIGWKMILRRQLMLTSPLLEAKTYISCKHLQTLFSVPVGCLGWGPSSKGTAVSPWGLVGWRVFAVPSVIGGRVGLLCLVLSLAVWMPKTLLCTSFLWFSYHFEPTRLNTEPPQSMKKKGWTEPQVFWGHVQNRLDLRVTVFWLMQYPHVIFNHSYAFGFLTQGFAPYTSENMGIQYTVIYSIQIYNILYYMIQYTRIKRCWLILGIHSFQVKILGCVSRHQGRAVAWPKQLCEWRQLVIGFEGWEISCYQKELGWTSSMTEHLGFSQNQKTLACVFWKVFASFLRARLAVLRLSLIPTRYAICRNRFRTICVPLPFALFL